MGENKVAGIQMRNVKTVIIGDGAVGKTSLVITYVHNKFPEDYVPTVFDNYSSFMKYGDFNVTFAIWEVMNREESGRLRPLSYPETNVFLICFSLVSHNSLENVCNKWYPEISHYCKDVPFILVGTKLDLRDTDDFKDESISTEEALEVAKKLNAAAYFEVSALKQNNIKEVFDQVLRTALNVNKEKPKKERWMYIILN